VKSAIKIAANGGETDLNEGSNSNNSEGGNIKSQIKRAITVVVMKSIRGCIFTKELIYLVVKSEKSYFSPVFLYLELT